MVSAGQQGEKQTGQQNQDQRKSSAETKTTKQVSSQDNVLWPRPLLSLANSWLADHPNPVLVFTEKSWTELKPASLSIKDVTKWFCIYNEKS